MLELYLTNVARALDIGHDNMKGLRSGNELLNSLDDIPTHSQKEQERGGLKRDRCKEENLLNNEELDMRG